MLDSCKFCFPGIQRLKMQQQDQAPNAGRERKSLGDKKQDGQHPIPFLGI
jgi:hypothetical protein